MRVSFCRRACNIYFLVLVSGSCHLLGSIILSTIALFFNQNACRQCQDVQLANHMTVT